MNVKQFLIKLSILSLLGFSSCAGLSHHKDEAALKQVRKVAITGFALVQPASATAALSLNSGKVQAEAGGSMIPKASKEVDAMYQSLVNSFAKNVSWSVQAPGVMKQNPGYQAAYDRTMRGFQNKMPPNRGQVQYLVGGLMDNDSLRILGNEGRTALMKALGVDAIITARVDVVLSGTTVMGIGSRRPQAKLSFQVFTPNKDTADWFEGGIDGEESKTSVGATAFIDEALLSRLALESAQSAFRKIGKES